MVKPFGSCQANKNEQPKEELRGTRCRLPTQTCMTPSHSSTPTSLQRTLATFHRIQRILVLVQCCHVFEDNEAANKMIIKGRSPTMRHVSRTHRVALDWLFDRINLDPQIQIRYIDTKHQLADILTKGHFTRDEWNNLLHLFNISPFSSTCCTKNFSLMSFSTMAKRIQNQKEEERVVSKSRPAAMNISSSFLRQVSSTASSPIVSKSPGMPIASGKPDSKMSQAIEPSSIREKQRGDPSHQEEEDSEDSDNPAAETWYFKEELVAQNSEAWRETLAHGASQLTGKVKRRRKRRGTTTSKYRRTHRTIWEAVFSMVRKIYGKPPGDRMEDLNVNLAIW